MQKATLRPSSEPTVAPAQWELVLYIQAASGTSELVVASVKRYCNARLRGRYTLEILDIAQYSRQAWEDGVPAVPALVRKKPTPIRRLIGSLTADDYLAVGLGFQGAVCPGVA